MSWLVKAFFFDNYRLKKEELAFTVASSCLSSPSGLFFYLYWYNKRISWGPLTILLATRRRKSWEISDHPVQISPFPFFYVANKWWVGREVSWESLRGWNLLERLSNSTSLPRLVQDDRVHSLYNSFRVKFSFSWKEIKTCGRSSCYQSCGKDMGLRVDY